MDFATVVRLQGFARCWELIHNRGRFGTAARAIWEQGNGSPFARYLALSEQILAAEGRLYGIGKKRLEEHATLFLARTDL